MIPFRELDVVVYFFDGFFDGPAQVSPSNAVFDRNISRVLFPVYLRGAIQRLDRAELSQRYPFTGRGDEPNVFNRFLSIPIRGKVAQHQVISLLALQDLSQRAAANRGLNRILLIGRVDAKPSGPWPINREVQVGLANYPEKAQIFYAGDGLE